MVAYNYKSRFVVPTLDLTKIGTIRSEGRKRHARPEEALQHYTGSRFRAELFARSLCRSVDPIRLHIHVGRVEVGDGDARHDVADLDAFAVGDGFSQWDDLARFWADTHELSRLGPWNGLWIRWYPESVRAP